MISKTEGDLLEAEKDLTKAIKLDYEDSEKYLTRAIIYCKQKAYLPAIDDLNDAIRYNPDNTQAYDLRSFAIKSLNEQKNTK